jgi:hypothetical protein
VVMLARWVCKVTINGAAFTDLREVLGADCRLLVRRWDAAPAGIRLGTALYEWRVIRPGNIAAPVADVRGPTKIEIVCAPGADKGLLRKSWRPGKIDLFANTRPPANGVATIATPRISSVFSAF